MLISRIRSKYLWIIKRLVQIPAIQHRLIGLTPSPQRGSCKDTILVVRPENIGDIVLLTAFLADLRHDYPKSKIIVAGRSPVITILHGDTRWDSLGLECFDDNINVYDLPTPNLIRKLKTIYEYALHIDKEHRPRYVVHPRPESDLHLAGLFTSVFSRRSFGFSDGVIPTRKLHNPRADQYYFNVAHQVLGVHEVDRVGSMLPLLGSQQRNRVPSLTPNDSGIKLDDKSITLGIGAASGERELPDNMVIGILKFLSTKASRVFIVGAKGDSSRAKKLLATAGLPTSDDLCGRFPLDSVGHVIGQSRLYIGPDSGLMHIATAVGVPVLVVSGYTGSDPLHSNSPERFGPANNCGVVIRPPHRNEHYQHIVDIGSVSIDDVIHSLGEILNV